MEKSQGIKRGAEIILQLIELGFDIALSSRLPKCKTEIWQSKVVNQSEMLVSLRGYVLQLGNYSTARMQAFAFNCVCGVPKTTVSLYKH